MTTATARPVSAPVARAAALALHRAGAVATGVGIAAALAACAPVTTKTASYRVVGPVTFELGPGSRIKVSGGPEGSARLWLHLDIAPGSSAALTADTATLACGDGRVVALPIREGWSTDAGVTRPSIDYPPGVRFVGEGAASPLATPAAGDPTPRRASGRYSNMLSPPRDCLGELVLTVPPIELDGVTSPPLQTHLRGREWSDVSIEVLR
jgi:hypothetical protein